MFFYNFTNDFKNEYNNLIDQNNYYIDYFNNTLKIAIAQRNTLLEFMNKITTYIGNATKFKDSNDVLSILENLKKNLDFANFNIESIKELLVLLDTVKEILLKIDTSTLNYVENDVVISLDKDLQNFNCKLNKNQAKIFQNSLEIEQFMTNSIAKFNFSLPTSDNVEAKIKEAELVNDKPKQILASQITDNKILIISETEQKVFLPYLVTDLENKLCDTKNKYANIEELISSEYVLPLSKFSSPILARFRESFYLMRNKENASLSKSFDLAFELAFNSLLHPAIISACKTIDELDIYLSCLEENQLEKFDIFEIKFEILPTIKNK